MKLETPFRGPALFSYGFRPFFFAAILFAVGVIPLWWFVWTGRIGLYSPFAPVDWHIHEMIYGYGAAVVAGFLFTAVPNWTGRLPTRGWPLAGLLAVWTAGRLGVGLGAGLGPVVVAVVDQAFLLLVVLMVAREIVAGRNWRNLKILVPISLLWLANLGFHVEAATSGTAAIGHRAGIALLIFLITLIGGRIIPSFTRNWLVQRGAPSLPTPFGRYDGLSIASGVVALAVWVAMPAARFGAATAGVAAILHLVRLARWKGMATWRSPLLLMLHVAYLFVPAGFLAAVAQSVGFAGPAVAPHVFGIGAIAGMTVAVMMRATMGHTGRKLAAGWVLTGAFIGVALAAALRVAAEWMGIGLGVAVISWCVAYLLMFAKMGPMLIHPKIARRVPSGLKQRS